MQTSKIPKSLLIIEDSVSITYRLVRLLKEVNNLNLLGSVRNGTTGYKRIVNEKPDIVLLDLQLPGTHGLKVLELMAEEKQQSHVIVLTNNSNLYFKEKCYNLGAKEFYDKTVQFEDAVMSITKLCNETD